MSEGKAKKSPKTGWLTRLKREQLEALYEYFVPEAEVEPEHKEFTAKALIKLLEDIIKASDDKEISDKLKKFVGYESKKEKKEEKSETPSTSQSKKKIKEENLINFGKITNPEDSELEDIEKTEENKIKSKMATSEKE